jgi:hypothetical protein
VSFPVDPRHVGRPARTQIDVSGAYSACPGSARQLRAGHSSLYREKRLALKPCADCELGKTRLAEHSLHQAIIDLVLPMLEKRLRSAE